MRAHAALFLLTAATGCASRVGDLRDDPNGGPPGPGFSADPGSIPVAGGCAEENKQVYVVTRQHELYRFAPASLGFSKIGTLSCPATGGPVSMAVDRHGTAWVHYDDGGIYHASTADASCRATGFAIGQSGFRRWGMAFVGTATAGESLYVFDHTRGLARIDASSLVLQGLAPATGWSELTGTSDGQLLAFQSPQTLASVDRASGALREPVTVSGVSAGYAFAFAHWGGDFWMFTAEAGKSSVVTQHHREDNRSSVRIADAGMVVVGAGVSTCAPLTGAPDLPR